MLLKRCRGFCHLHQGDNSLLHSGSAGAAENNDGQFFFGSALHHECDLFTYHMPHAAHQESGIADTKAYLLAVDFTHSHGNSLVKTCLFLHVRKLLLISREIQRITDIHLLKPGDKGTPVTDHADSVFCSDTEIASAGSTDIVIEDCILLTDLFLAAWADDHLLYVCSVLLFLFMK